MLMYHFWHGKRCVAVLVGHGMCVRSPLAGVLLPNARDHVAMDPDSLHTMDTGGGQILVVSPQQLAGMHEGAFQSHDCVAPVCL